MITGVGTDSSKLPGIEGLPATDVMERAAGLGLDGVFFRSPFELSATIDPAEIADVAATARDLGLYLEVGVTKVNPFATPEAPEIRAFGGGDWLAGVERIIRALAAGVLELWAATANYKFLIPGMYACDRFRTDVDWSTQLTATAKVLGRLGPILRDTGAHLNLETHEEITSFEVVRLVEDAGPDAFGITFDTANVVVRCEDPVVAAERVAPYTRLTHVRDVALHPTDDGLGRYLAPVGTGIIDWPALLAPLAASPNRINLSIEGHHPHSGRVPALPRRSGMAGRSPRSHARRGVPDPRARRRLRRTRRSWRGRRSRRAADARRRGAVPRIHHRERRGPARAPRRPRRPDRARRELRREKEQRMALPVVKNTVDVGSDHFPTLSLAERDRRWGLVRGLMSTNGLDALLVFGQGRNSNDWYLTNEERHATVLLTATEEPLMFLGDVPLDRYDEAGARFDHWTDSWVHGPFVPNLVAALDDRALTTATIGVVGLTSRAVGQWAGVIPFRTWTAVLQALPGATFVDVSEAYEVLSVVKSDEELEMIRKASALGEAACAAYVDAVAVGVRESVPPAAALNAIVAGGGWFKAPFILERAGAHRFAWGHPEWFGTGAAPHVLQAGDSIASEVFAFYGGFESQQQIDVVIGEPDKLLRELEEICLESYRAGIEALRPGLRFAELAEIMDAPLAKSKTWNTGPMVQTVSGVLFNSSTRLNPGVDPALGHLPKLPSGVPIDGDFEIVEGVPFAFEPNALRDGKRVCIGGTVVLSSRGVEELNTIPNRLVAVVSE